MRDKDAGPGFREKGLVDVAHQVNLGGRVERRSLQRKRDQSVTFREHAERAKNCGATHRLVKEENLGVLEQDARDRHALLLSPRDHHPPLANLGQPLVRQTLDRLRDVGQPRRLFHFIVRRIEAAVSDVVQNVAMEEGRLLRDDTNLTPQRLELNIVQLLPVDKDLAGRWLVEPEQEAEDGRFAAARGTDNANFLAGRDRKRNVAVRVIAEGNVLETDLASLG